MRLHTFLLKKSLWKQNCRKLPLKVLQMLLHSFLSHCPQLSAQMGKGGGEAKQEGAPRPGRPSVFTLEGQPSGESSEILVHWQKALVMLLNWRPEGGNKALSAEKQGAGKINKTRLF